MKNKNIARFLFVILLMALTACGGGGGGGTSSTPNNLSAKSIRIMTADPKIAYPLDVSVNMTADVAATNVPISIFAIDKTDDPNADVRQIQLGTATIPQVNAGNGDYTVSVTIPSSVATSGSYYISAIVDPANVISETDEEDNTVYVESSISPKGNPNVKITDLNTDRLAMLLNTDPWDKQVTGTTYTDTYTNANNVVVSDVIPNTHNTNAGATITVSADGLATNETIDIEARATLKVVRTDNNNAEIDVPLYLWNTAGGSFIDSYGTGAYGSSGQWVPIGTYSPQLVNYDTTTEESTLDDVKAHKIELGFYFPDTLAEFINQALRHPPANGNWNAWATTMKNTAVPPDLTNAAMNNAVDFIKGIAGAGDEAAALANMQISLCVEIQPTNTGDADTSDNKLCKPLDISLPPDPVPPPTTPPVTIPSGYPMSTWTSHNLTDPIEIGGNYDGKGGGSVFGYGPLDFGAGISQDYRGYIQEARGVIPLTVFGTPYEFMNAVARAQLVPNYAGKPATETTGYKVELSFLGVMLYSKNEASSRTDTISFSKEAPDPEKEQQYFVGPVPVVAGASVTGNIGIEFEYGFTNDDGTHGPLNFGSTVTPFANVEASMHAGVGTVVFSAGVKGVLTLLDERLPLFVGGTYLTVHDDGFSSGNVDFEVNQGATLSNVFTGPQGTLYLYAKYSKPKLVTCTWPFGIKGKCLVIKSVEVTKDIWRSPALFKLNDILLEAALNKFEVVIIGGAEPTYYTSN
jgi:hypothetical protein